MNRKITTAEFESYEKKLWPLFVHMLETPEFKEWSEEEKKQGEKLLILFSIEIKKGNVLALWAGCDLVEQNLEENSSTIRSRIKEHIVARENYNPATPLSLTEWRERRKKRGWGEWKNIYGNQELRYSLLSEMSGEDYQFIHRIFSFWEEIDKIIPGDKKKLTEEAWKETGFIFEDILKTLEAAQNKLEAKKKRFVQFASSGL